MRLKTWAMRTEESYCYLLDYAKQQNDMLDRAQSGKSQAYRHWVQLCPRFVAAQRKTSLHCCLEFFHISNKYACCRRLRISGYKFFDSLPIKSWDYIFSPWICVGTVTGTVTMEVLLCQFLGPDLKTGGSTSCLLDHSLLETSHYAVRKPKQPCAERPTWRGTRAPSQQPQLRS